MDAFIDPDTLVVINLDRCSDTLESFRLQNAHLGPVRRFPAIAGASADRTALQVRGDIVGEIDYTDGALGCALSHFALWREIADGTRAVTVCEDDAVFAPDFVPTASARLAALQDGWDIVVWGWNFDSWLIFRVLPDLPACLVYGNRAVTAADLAAATHAPASPQLFRLDRASGTLCYTLSPKGAARMLGHCRPLRRRPILIPETGFTLPNSGIDLIMSVFYPEVMAYVSVPPLAISPNIAANSTTKVTDPAGLLRRIGELPFISLVAALDRGDLGADPGTKAGFYKAWIDANGASDLLFAAWFNLGITLEGAEDHSNAIVAYQNALTLKPDLHPASANLHLMQSRSADMRRRQPT